jgi:glyoxylase-like metal-dependent hydrolase (beta-lactamase superfamily II)
VSPDAPESCTGLLKVLVPGSDASASCTVTYARDAEVRCVVDPGPAAHPRGLVAALISAGVPAEAVTDVVFTHRHPEWPHDSATFPNARVHDHRAALPADGAARSPGGLSLAPSIRLIATPGRGAGDLTVLIGTPFGVVALTHLWWSADDSGHAPGATHSRSLDNSRRRVLAIATHIVPGHGPEFRAGPDTPL